MNSVPSIDHDAPDRVDFELMFERLTAAIGGAGELRKRYRELDFELFGLTLAETFRTPAAASVIGLLLIQAQQRDQECIALAARVSDLEDSLLGTRNWDGRSLSSMIAWVARDQRLSAIAIIADTRDEKHFTARQAIAWVARDLLGYSYPRIGRALGQRDHTTILNSVRRAESRRALDQDFRDLCDRLRNAFAKAHRS